VVALLRSAHFHWWATIAWIVLGGATTLFFPNAVWWIAFMSLYANIATHWTSYQAALTEEKIDDKPEPLDPARLVRAVGREVARQMHNSHSRSSR
jgi:hypothetical protein